MVIYDLRILRGILCQVLETNQSKVINSTLFLKCFTYEGYNAMDLLNGAMKLPKFQLILCYYSMCIGIGGTTTASSSSRTLSVIYYAISQFEFVFICIGDIIKTSGDFEPTESLDFAVYTKIDGGLCSFVASLSSQLHLLVESNLYFPTPAVEQNAFGFQCRYYSHGIITVPTVKDWDFCFHDILDHSVSDVDVRLKLVESQCER
uniref:Uncharacterized protein n=1 Tax=Glossina pallidipes TaxID=7398 RepID=A0A1B0A2S4_GLOPL